MSTNNLQDQHQILALLAQVTKDATSMNEVAQRFIDATKPSHCAMHVLDGQMVSLDNFLLKLTNQLFIKGDMH